MNAVAHPSLLEDRQTRISINSFSSLTYWVQTVIVSAANSKHKLKPHSSFKAVSDYLCPADELTAGGMFSSTCQISIFCRLYASCTLARPSLYLHKLFLMKLRSLFSSKASSPSMIRLNPNDRYLSNTRMLQNIHNPSNPRTV